MTAEPTSATSAVRVTHYSDILCVWAYIGQARIDELAAGFPAEVEIETRFCSVFPDPHAKIVETWTPRGDGDGFENFNHHLREIGGRFPHAPIHPRVWLDVRPATSAAPHLFVKGAQMVEMVEADAPTKPYAERDDVRVAWALRRAFFAEGRDVAAREVQHEVAADLGLDAAAIEEAACTPEALRLLVRDYGLAQKDKVEGSPTILMNEGRQVLFGNVGYRVIEANVKELLRQPAPDEFSWC
jgi:predicted DsbA family dithiol-disulfide isomerase